ncbi:hypothetical protein ACFQU1_20330 [Chelatococcus sp. GCM10030263]|uniref:hypothetical protein n=1 Tax=Chelatococcus sp. GCM10030263 TaxID=3273387 RepID=UPI0036195F99
MHRPLPDTLPADPAAQAAVFLEIIRSLGPETTRELIERVTASTRSVDPSTACSQPPRSPEMVQE